MQDRFDTEMMVERAKDMARELRESEAYPAVIGAIAGGIAGALMAAIIASQFAPRRSDVEEDEHPTETRSRARHVSRAGFDARQLVELISVIGVLIKQAREWIAEEKSKRA